jgi:hypothetical protein
LSERRVYFSHGYKAEDRTINEFFWEALRPYFYALIDTGLSDGSTGEKLPMDIAFNEWMLSRCDGFVAIVPNRESLYQKLEYKLATRIRLPRLVFLEEGRTLSTLLDDIRVTYPTGWKRFFEKEQQSNISKAIARFSEQVDAYVQGQQALISAGHWSRPAPGTFKIALLPPKTGSWTKATSILQKHWRDDIKFHPIDPSVLHSEFSIVNELAGCDLLVVDVGPRGTPAEFVGFLHGIGVPQIRVCEIGSVKEQRELDRTLAELTPRSLSGEHSKNGLPRFLDGYKLDAGMTPVCFWRTPDELAQQIQKTARRVSRFQTSVLRLEGRHQARVYFGLRYPQPRRANVFLSFAGAGDRTGATAQIAKALRFLGFQCFHYQDPGLTGDGRLESGEDIREGLRMHIEDANIVVALLDPPYQRSDFCMTELRTAGDLHKRGELELLPFGIKRPRSGSVRDVLKGKAIVEHINATTWDNPRIIEDIIEAVEQIANDLGQMRAINALQLREWLQADGRNSREDLLRPLTQINVPQDIAENWIKTLSPKNWCSALLELPKEKPARRQHRELLTMLLLSLAEENDERRAAIEKWLRISLLLTWSDIDRPEQEEDVHIGVPSLGVDVPADEGELAEALGREMHDLLIGKGPLCLTADGRALSSPVEIAREGKDAEPLALLRPIRWRLKDVPTRKSLDESRQEYALPPSVMLISLASADLLEPDREVRQLKTILETEIQKRGWPTARIVAKRAKNAKELLNVLSETRHRIVHIAGHSGHTGLSVGKERVDAEVLAQALATSDVRLLILNGCSGVKARSALATGTITLADLLVIRGRVPEIVAHRKALQEDDAVAFAKRFYVEYLRDLDLGRAVHEGRKVGSPRLRSDLVAISQRPPERLADK